MQRLAKVEELTAREREVLNLLARSLSNKEIAEELLVSAETVKAHIKNLFKKLGVDRRMKAVSVAKTLGWLDERTP
ncbi:LuxR C-terminal-related transcriptional regulator [Paenibacillus thiaminolyticus]|nr:LuxR C-terminal-related transcriptional regulator [Paenibacillus thiaminolyticus]WCR30078.1 LuxR C-terminal-related transcriptional regulator [Paenibacillus thiaminolyticus]